MANVPPSPGYTETDIQELIKDRRLLAAIDAYARDRLTMGQAMVLVEPPLVPERFNLNIVAYQRVIHEIAKRISAGKIEVPTELMGEYPAIYSEPPPQIPSYLNSGARAHRFSELENIAAELNPLTVRRDWFDEDDIRELTKDPRILACIDAYGHEIINFAEAHRRMFDIPNYLPRNLSNFGLIGIAFEVAHRIRDGRITLSSTLRADFPFAYAPQPTKQA